MYQLSVQTNLTRLMRVWRSKIERSPRHVYRKSGLDWEIRGAVNKQSVGEEREEDRGRLEQNPRGKHRGEKGGKHGRWIERRVKSSFPSHFAYATSKAAVEIVWNESGLRVEPAEKKRGGRSAAARHALSFQDDRCEPPKERIRREIETCRAAAESATLAAGEDRGRRSLPLRRPRCHSSHRDEHAGSGIDSTRCDVSRFRLNTLLPSWMTFELEFRGKLVGTRATRLCSIARSRFSANWKHQVAAFYFPITTSYSRK